MQAAAKAAAKAADAEASLSPEERAHRDRVAHVNQARTERRLKLVVIPHTFLQFLLQAGIDWQSGPAPLKGKMCLPTSRPPLPADAAILGCNYHPDRDVFVIGLCSMEFEPVPANESPQFLEPAPAWVWTEHAMHVQETTGPDGEKSMGAPK